MVFLNFKQLFFPTFQKQYFSFCWIFEAENLGANARCLIFLAGSFQIFATSLRASIFYAQIVSLLFERFNSVIFAKYETVCGQLLERMMKVQEKFIKKYHGLTLSAFAPRIWDKLKQQETIWFSATFYEMQKLQKVLQNRLVGWNFNLLKFQFLF